MANSYVRLNTLEASKSRQLAVCAKLGMSPGQQCQSSLSSHPKNTGTDAGLNTARLVAPASVIGRRHLTFAQSLLGTWKGGLQVGLVQQDRRLGWFRAQKLALGRQQLLMFNNKYYQRPWYTHS